MTTLLNDLALGVKQADTFTVDDIIPLLKNEPLKPIEMYTFLGLLCVMPMEAIDAQHKRAELDRGATITAQTIHEQMAMMVNITSYMAEDKELDNAFISKLMNAEGLSYQTMAQRLELITEMVDLIDGLTQAIADVMWDDIKNDTSAVMGLGSTAVQVRMLKSCIVRAMNCIK